MEGILQGLTIPPIWTHAAAFVAGFVFARRVSSWAAASVRAIKGVLSE